MKVGVEVRVGVGVREPFETTAALGLERTAVPRVWEDSPKVG